MLTAAATGGVGRRVEARQYGQSGADASDEQGWPTRGI